MAAQEKSQKSLESNVNIEQEVEKPVLSSEELDFLMRPTPMFNQNEYHQLEDKKAQLRQERSMAYELPTEQEKADYVQAYKNLRDYAERVRNARTSKASHLLSMHRKDAGNREEKIKSLLGIDSLIDNTFDRDYYLRQTKRLQESLARLKKPNVVQEKPTENELQEFNKFFDLVQENLKKLDLSKKQYKTMHSRFKGVFIRLQTERAAVQPEMDERDPNFNKILIKAQTIRSLTDDLKNINQYLNQFIEEEKDNYERNIKIFEQKKEELQKLIPLIPIHLQKLLGTDAEYPKFLMKRFSGTIQKEEMVLQKLTDNEKPNYYLSSIEKLNNAIQELQYELKNPWKRNMSMTETEPELNLDEQVLAQYKVALEKDLKDIFESEPLQEPEQDAITDRFTRAAPAFGKKQKERKRKSEQKEADTIRFEKSTGERETQKYGASELLSDVLEEQKAFQQRQTQNMLGIDAEDLTKTAPRLGLEQPTVKRKGLEAEDQTVLNKLEQKLPEVNLNLPDFSKPFVFNGVDLQSRAQDLMGRDSRAPKEMKSDLKKIDTYFQRLENMAENKDADNIELMQEGFAYFLDRYENIIDQTVVEKAQESTQTQEAVTEIKFNDPVQEIEDKYNSISEFISKTEDTLAEFAKRYGNESLGKKRMQNVYQLFAELNTIFEEMNNLRSQDITIEDKTMQIRILINKFETLQDQFKQAFDTLSWQTEFSEYVAAFNSLEKLEELKNSDYSDDIQTFVNLIKQGFTELKFDDITPETQDKISETKLQIQKNIEDVFTQRARKNSIKISELSSNSFIQESDIIHIREIENNLRVTTNSLSEAFSNSNQLIHQFESILKQQERLDYEISKVQKSLEAEIDQVVDENLVGDFEEGMQEAQTQEVEQSEQEKLDDVRRRLQQLGTEQENPTPIGEPGSQEVNVLEIEDDGNYEEVLLEDVKVEENLESSDSIISEFNGYQEKLKAVDFENNKEASVKFFEDSFRTMKTFLNECHNQYDKYEKISENRRYREYNGGMQKRIESLSQQLESLDYLVNHVIRDVTDSLAQYYQDFIISQKDKEKTTDSVMARKLIVSSWNNSRNYILKVLSTREELAIQKLRLEAQVKEAKSRENYEDTAQKIEQQFKQELERFIGKRTRTRNGQRVYSNEQLIARGMAFDEALFGDEKKSNAPEAGGLLKKVLGLLNKSAQKTEQFQPEPLAVSRGRLNTLIESIDGIQTTQKETGYIAKLKRIRERIKEQVLLAGFNFTKPQADEYVLLLNGEYSTVPNKYEDSRREPTPFRDIVGTAKTDFLEFYEDTFVTEIDDLALKSDQFQVTSIDREKTLFKNSLELLARNQVDLDNQSSIYYRLLPEVKQQYIKELTAANKVDKLSASTKALYEMEIPSGEASNEFVIDASDLLEIYGELLMEQNKKTVGIGQRFENQYEQQRLKRSRDI